MCGRYELHTHPAALALAFGLPHPPDITPRYNIAPMQNVPVIRRAADGARELAQVRWGLVPRWAKDPSIGARMINARGETIATKSAFRRPFERHRCLIPADGFYEWKTLPGGRKVPFHVTMKDGRPFAFAGVAERWLGADGEVIDSCAIVTTAANTLLRPVHERMPVIVAPGDYERWLDVSGDTPPIEVVAPFASEAMALQPVSSRVNSVRNDDAALLVPVAAEAEAAEPEDAVTASGVAESPQQDLF
ncbi:MAG TPA: SOS response-associated peptidase [Casimicrobiaceae bacterium]|jgi:putative SOS response-associated peptidase YedK|nr:SOS response-associated peptidase [Casimicrobiaceae bacterium]